MEIAEEFKPTFAKKTLWKQVKEQGRVCDFNLKVGIWEKRFHSSILMASPFFECIIDGQHLSRRQATVERRDFSPATVEMAVMFLYGKCPDVREDNINELLNLAEFLMIPNLKALCVKHAECIPVTNENLKAQLELMSLYDFDKKPVTEYVHSHLDELLESDVLLSATNEFIANLFENETLRFVSMDTRILFLMRRNKCSDTERTHLQKLFGLIDMNKVSAHVLEGAKGEFGIEWFSQNSSHVKLYCPLEPRDVLVPFIRDKFEISHVYDISNDIWYNSPYISILDILKINPCIFASTQHDSKYRIFDSSKVIMVDLANDISRTITLSKENELPFEEVCGNASTVVAYCSRTKHLSRKLQSLYGKMAVYIGKMDDYSPNISMKALCSFNFYHDSKIYINDANTCLFTNGQDIILFNTDSYQIDVLNIKISHSDNVIPLDDGFVIHNDERFICIHRVYGQNIKGRFETRKFDLPQDNSSQSFQYMHRQSKYRLVGNLWIRQRYSDNQVISEKAVERYCLKWITDLNEMKWEKFSLPFPLSQHLFSQKTPVLLTSIPYVKLRCHLECPCLHCKASRKIYMYTGYKSKMYTWKSEDDDSVDEHSDMCDFWMYGNDIHPNDYYSGVSDG